MGLYLPDIKIATCIFGNLTSPKIRKKDHMYQRVKNALSAALQPGAFIACAPLQ
jgi:hypothetical protein